MCVQLLACRPVGVRCLSSGLVSPDVADLPEHPSNIMAHMARSISELCALIIDDEPDILSLYEMSLARLGVQVVAAGSLAEAMQALQAADRFGICITDLRLPDGLVWRWFDTFSSTGLIFRWRLSRRMVTWKPPPGR